MVMEALSADEVGATPLAKVICCVANLHIKLYQRHESKAEIPILWGAEWFFLSTRQR